MKNRTQFGVIAISASLLILSGILAFGIVQSFMQANLFETDGQSITHNISVPISYEKHINQGDQLFSRGYMELAIESYLAAAEEKDEHPEAHEKIGFAYSKLGQHENAATAFKKAYERSESTLHGSYYANALIQTADFTAAQSLLDSLDPEAQEVIYGKALLLLLSNEYNTARELLQKVNDMDGHVDPVYTAALLTAFQNYDEQQGGQEIYLKATLNKALIDVEQFKIAETLALNILQDHSDYRDVWSLLGYAKLQMSDYTGAEDAFKQAKALDPIKPEIHYFLGTSHYFQEEYEEATESFELALLYGFQPEVEVYRKLAESQLFIEDYEEAIGTYEYLIKVDPYDIELFIRPLWIAVEVLGELDRALSLAETALETFPEEPMSEVLMASVLLAQNRLEEAEGHVNIALEMDPDSAEAHYNAGLIQEAKGNIEGAKWEYEKAHELAEAGDSISEKASERYNLLLNPESTEE